MAIKLDFSQRTFEKAKKDAGKDKDKKFGADFSAVLGKVEQALANEKKSKGDGSVIEACMAAMEQAADEAQGLSKNCDAKQDKELIAALKKFIGDCDAELKRLEDSLEDADDDDGEGADINIDELLNPECFSRYLKMAKNAENPADGAGFCFAFHKDAEKCKLTMLNPSKVKKEYSALKRGLPKLGQGYKKRLMIFGTSYKDPENKKMLVLACDPKSKLPPVPGMDKKLKMWAKANKAILKGMKKLLVIGPGGERFESDDLEEGDAAIPEEQATRTSAATDAAAATGAKGVGDPHLEAAEAPGTRASVGAGVQDAAQMEDKRKLFRKARQNWQSAKEKAIQDLEAVKDGIRDYYLDDPEMFKVATGKLSQLDGIMDNLGDELRDILDKYVSTPKSRQDQLQQLASEASATVERFLSYVGSDPLLNAVDNEQEMGLEKIKVREPLQKALKDLVKSLG